ncbi:MAG: hypothetical protein IT200_14905 [Thermoleophilia bacterium]|nr:hypothetical protein [Thermoleophilia bacterium]
MRRALLVAAAAAVLGPAAATADGAVHARITSIRVITADTRVAASPPYRRDRAYAYVVRYRITGAGTLRVKRRAVLRTAGGTVIARVAPPAESGESGEYFASARLPVGARDPRTTYVLGYVVQVTGAGGARARAARSVRLRFV